MQKEMRSPVQNTALVKWKTPSWVPPEARPFVKANDPTVLAGVNTPRLADSPEEWAHWLWRYPKEASLRPGVRRTAQGVNLSSVRGLLLVTGRAPRRNGFIRARTAFFTRAAQLIATPGLYRCLVDELRLTIAVVPGLTSAQPVNNVTVEDVARLFARDGVTIPQIGDAYEWGHTALITWSQGMDTAQRTEAMSALQVARQQSSMDNADRLIPLEPRWWYAPAEVNRGTSSQTIPTACSQVPAERVVPPPKKQLPPLMIPRGS